MRIIKGALQAGLFGGALALLSPVAFADEPVTSSDEATTQVPDHAQAEERSGAAAVVPTVERVENVPNHAQAEARGSATTTVPTVERLETPPDHATAERRGAPSDQDR